MNQNEVTKNNAAMKLEKKAHDMEARTHQVHDEKMGKIKEKPLAQAEEILHKRNAKSQQQSFQKM